MNSVWAPKESPIANAINDAIARDSDYDLNY